MIKINLKPPKSVNLHNMSVQQVDENPCKPVIFFNFNQDGNNDHQEKKKKDKKKSKKSKSRKISDADSNDGYSSNSQFMNNDSFVYAIYTVLLI